jgi:Myb-like DNA-binding domain
MTNSIVRFSNVEKNNNDLFFSPCGPMDENEHPNENNKKLWPLDRRDSHYKLKLLQQQLLQQQAVVVELSSSSLSSSAYDEYLHSSSIHNNNAADPSSASPLMVLAAAAAATKTMNHSSSSFSSIMQHPKCTAGLDASPADGRPTTPFCTTDFADQQTAFAMAMTSSQLYSPYPPCATTPTNSSNVPDAARRLACLAAISSHVRNAVAATHTPCRMERMLLDEQKCLMAMSSSGSPYAHPLFAATDTLHDDTTTELRFNVRWNREEDSRLEQAVELEGPAWALIATKYFGNTRSQHQCRSRWKKVRC